MFNRDEYQIPPGHKNEYPAFSSAESHKKAIRIIYMTVLILVIIGVVLYFTLQIPTESLLDSSSDELRSELE